MNKLKSLNSMRTINKFKLPVNRQILYTKKQEIEGSEVSDPNSFALKNNSNNLKSNDYENKETNTKDNTKI